MTTKIIELRKAISTLLLTVHSRVYYEDADDKAAFPYLVFNLVTSIDDGTLENFVLDVDAWDAPIGGDTTALETLISNVDAALHRKTIYETGKVCVTFYRENRLTLRDDDKRIRRRKYIFQCRVFHRN